MTGSVDIDLRRSSRDQQLIRILYTSVSLLREDSTSLLFDLMTLLDVSMTYNRRHGITGVLAYRNSAFLQVIEGPVAAVETLYSAICQDRRHRDVRLILNEPFEQRCFPVWSMAYLGYEHDLRAQFDEAQRHMTPAAIHDMVGALARLLV